MREDLKESNEKVFINPIVIDDKSHDGMGEINGKTETKLINPIVIDENFHNDISPLVEKVEVKLVNPITIDIDYLTSKEKTTQEKENIKLMSTIVVNKEITHNDTQNIDETENTSEQICMQGFSKAVYEYILKNGLDYDSMKLLIPQHENSIGAAKSLLSVLPDVVYDAKEKKLQMWNCEYWKNVSESHFRKMCIKLLERQYDMASLCGILDKNMINNGKNPTFEGVISMIKNISDLPSSKFNSAERVLCLKNGVFSFDDLMLHPFEDYKNCYITKQIDCNYSQMPHRMLSIIFCFPSWVITKMSDIYNKFLAMTS